MHTSFPSKSPLLEKPAPNFNCDTNHSKITNNSIAKLNSNKSTDATGLQPQSNANNTMDLNQKYGFIIGEDGEEIEFERNVLVHFMLTENELQFNR